MACAWHVHGVCRACALHGTLRLPPRRSLRDGSIHDRPDKLGRAELVPREWLPRAPRLVHRRRECRQQPRPWPLRSCPELVIPRARRGRSTGRRGHCAPRAPRFGRRGGKCWRDLAASQPPHRGFAQPLSKRQLPSTSRVTTFCCCCDKNCGLLWKSERQQQQQLHTTNVSYSAHTRYTRCLMCVRNVRVTVKG